MFHCKKELVEKAINTHPEDFLDVVLPDEKGFLLVGVVRRRLGHFDGHEATHGAELPLQPANAGFTRVLRN